MFEWLWWMLGYEDHMDPVTEVKMVRGIRYPVSRPDRQPVYDARGKLIAVYSTEPYFNYETAF